MNRLVSLLATLAATMACQRAPEQPRVTVEDALVTVPAVPGGPGAAYFTLRTDGDPARLVSIASDSVARIELHGTTGGDGISRMAPLQPGETRFSRAEPLRFAPGGKHAMLFGVNPSLRPGGTVGLTLSLDSGPPVTVEAEVRGPGQVHAGH